MTLTEKTAYIKGLCEGLGLCDKDTAEAKVINELISLCEEMSLEIEDIDSEIDNLYDFCDELDEDLGDVEELLVDDDCDGDCDSCDSCDDCEFCDDDDYYEIICPSCGETVCFDESVAEKDTLICPACGSEIGNICDDEE